MAGNEFKIAYKPTHGQQIPYFDNDNDHENKAAIQITKNT